MRNKSFTALKHVSGTAVTLGTKLSNEGGISNTDPHSRSRSGGRGERDPGNEVATQ